MADGKLLIGEFRAGTSETHVEAVVKDKRFCTHRFYELDENARTVTCKECNSVCDAFSVLLDYAKGERLWRHYEGDRISTARRLAELQEEERKVKARTRSASRKDAEAAVAAERRRAFEAHHRALWRVQEIIRCAKVVEHALNPSNLPIPIAPPASESGDGSREGGDA